MTEDWVLNGILLVSFGLPLVFLIGMDSTFGKAQQKNFLTQFILHSLHRHLDPILACMNTLQSFSFANIRRITVWRP
jgi:hypothetical protein